MKTKEGVAPPLKALIGLLLVILLLPILLIVGSLYYLWGFILSMLLWIVWAPKDRCILFVYSNSPIWLDYIEQEILPHIRTKAVILNWSERKNWRPSLEVLSFQCFGGRKNFNPIAIVFRPFRLNKMFRFYEAFQDYKHGKSEKLVQLKADFLSFINF